MRSSNKCREKLYTKSWCIYGEKFNLLENSRKCYPNKQSIFRRIQNIYYEHSVDEQSFMKNNKPDIFILQHNQKEYESNKLKHVHYTVKEKDNNRILKNFYMSSGASQLSGQYKDKCLTTIKAEKIYETFFCSYYKFFNNSSNDN